jgi:hypothetical protein
VSSGDVSGGRECGGGDVSPRQVSSGDVRGRRERGGGDVSSRHVSGGEHVRGGEHMSGDEHASSGDVSGGWKSDKRGVKGRGVARGRAGHAGLQGISAVPVPLYPLDKGFLHPDSGDQEAPRYLQLSDVYWTRS